MFIFKKDTPQWIRDEVQSHVRERSRAKHKLVHGVGLNDAPYLTAVHLSDGSLWQCPIYIKWVSMLARCYSRRFQKSSPSYEGCKVCTEWHSFMNFYEWGTRNNFPCEWALDKDIIVPNNKLYSPDTCVFVPEVVNSFVLVPTSNTNLPTGVTLSKGRYRAHCSNPLDKNASRHIGQYDTADDAVRAYKATKNKYALDLIERYSDMDERVKTALSTRYNS